MAHGAIVGQGLVAEVPDSRVGGVEPGFADAEGTFAGGGWAWGSGGGGGGEEGVDPIGRVGCGHDAVPELEVVHTAGHRAADGRGVVDVDVGGATDPLVRRFQAVDPAVGAGNPDATAAVAAECEREKIARHRCCRGRRGAAGVVMLVLRVRAGAGDGVVAAGVQAVLVHVDFADDDAAGLLPFPDAPCSAGV